MGGWKEDFLLVCWFLTVLSLMLSVFISLCQMTFNWQHNNEETPQTSENLPEGVLLPKTVYLDDDGLALLPGWPVNEKSKTNTFMSWRQLMSHPVTYWSSFFPQLETSIPQPAMQWNSFWLDRSEAPGIRCWWKMHWESVHGESVLVLFRLKDSISWCSHGVEGIHFLVSGSHFWFFADRHDPLGVIESWSSALSGAVGWRQQDKQSLFWVLEDARKTQLPPNVLNSRKRSPGNVLGGFYHPLQSSE